MKRPLLISALLAWALPGHVLTLTIYPKEKRTTPKIVEIERNQLLHLLEKERLNESGQTENQVEDVVKYDYLPAQQQYQQYYSTDYYKHYLPSNEITVNLNGFPRGMELARVKGETPYQLVMTGQPTQHSHFTPNYIPPVAPYGLILSRLVLPSPVNYQGDENWAEYANGMRQHQLLGVQSLKLGYYTQTAGQDQQELDGVIYNSPVAAVYMNNQMPIEQTDAEVRTPFGTQPTKPVYHYQPVPKGTFSSQPSGEGPVKSDTLQSVQSTEPPHRQSVVQVAPLHMTQSSTSTGGSGDDLVKYDFGYRVVDEGSGLEFGKTEMKKDGLTQGSYHVLLPDGRLQVVKYWSDHTGYHTDISYSIPGKN